MRSSCGWTSPAPADEETEDAIPRFFRRDDGMTLLDGRARDVAARFLSPKNDFEQLPRSQTIEREPHAYECHRASLTRDVECRCGLEFFPFDKK